MFLGPGASFPSYSPKPGVMRQHYASTTLAKSTILKWLWLKERNIIYIAAISQLMAIK